MLAKGSIVNAVAVIAGALLGMLIKVNYLKDLKQL